jgi:integrase
MTTWTPEMREAASERAKRKRRPRGAGTVYRVMVDGERKYRAAMTVWDKDGKRRIITGTSGDQRTAIERRTRAHLVWLVEQGQADPSVLVTPETKVWTVAEWLQKWADEQSPRDVQANTRQRNRGLITNHIVPALGTKKLTALSTLQIQELFEETLPAKKDKDGAPLLGSSPLRGIYYILSSAMEEATKAKIIHEDPMRFMKPPKKTRKNVLNLGERLGDVAKLRRHLQDNRDDAVYWALSFYGLRASERLGLEWSSFNNLDGDWGKPATVTIDRQLYNDAENKTLSIKHDTKTEASMRVIPLSPDVRSLLYHLKLRRVTLMKQATWAPREGFEDLVYTTATGNPVRQSTDNTRWKKLLKDADVEPLRGHDMRHLTASYLAATGVPVEVVKSILGHNSVAMTSYYTHISNEQKMKAIMTLGLAYATDMEAYKPLTPKSRSMIRIPKKPETKKEA